MASKPRPISAIVAGSGTPETLVLNVSLVFGETWPMIFALEVRVAPPPRGAFWKTVKSVTLSFSTPMLASTGRCRFCEEKVTDSSRFCNADCRDDFERVKKIKQ